MSASEGSAHTDPPVRCEVVKTETGRFIDLTGQVSSDRELRGQYEFTLEKAGSGGSSSIAQAGDFRVLPGEQAKVGFTRINQDEGIRFKATLTVSWDGGKQACSVDEGTVAARGRSAEGTTTSSRGNTAVTVQKGSNNSSVIVQSN